MKMINFTRKRVKLILWVFAALLCVSTFGVFTHLFEKDFYTEFHYPYNVNLEKLVSQWRNGRKADVEPLNNYNFKYYKTCSKKCETEPPRLVFLIKSAPENVLRRVVIRQTWGLDKRFWDVKIVRIFLVGVPKTVEMEKKINVESHQFSDIVQANYTDSYFNNTLKTMSGFEWAAKYCNNASFYMFVDDDYYVSPKNVLRYIRRLSVEEDSLQKVDYLELDTSVRLYTGYVFDSSPLRHLTSKWYISLEEYPYHKWPPYVSAGAYILSKEALLDMYYTSFYTKHFRFDDIYVALLAYKAQIEPFHHDEFNYYKKWYTKESYKNTIASHGYGYPEELLKVWTEQKVLGHA